MKTIRRILFAQLVMALGLSLITATQVSASVTKVGNGDDGADLEVLTPITTGPIWRARQRAVEKLKQLNVAGVPGLGLLIPELERTDLMLAKKDVHPTGEQSGSVEVSEDKRLVYARTFAQPYAATRFFPASQQLTAEQLVALHIHEALHRALASDIRGNEDIVMHLTMAVTSPGANFDRIRQVAGLYMAPSNVAEFRAPAAESVGSLVSEQVVVPQQKPRTTFGYEFDANTDHEHGYNGAAQLHGLQFTTSLGTYRPIANYTVVPNFRARVKISSESNPKSFVGPTSFDTEGPFQIGEQTFAGPFARFTGKSLDETVYVKNDRDIVTFGGFYRTDADTSYFSSTLGYSMPSSSHFGSLDTDFKSIFSLTGHSGIKWRRFSFGGLAEIHASQGKETTQINYDYATRDPNSMKPFRLLVAGPEFGYTTDRFQIKAYVKWIMNEAKADLDDLGDVVDRGIGSGGFGTSLTMLF